MKKLNAMSQSALLIISALLFSCKENSKEQSPPQSQSDSLSLAGTPAEYAEDSMWLCLPGRDDVCAQHPETSELTADGSFVEVVTQKNTDNNVDCFYVHPTSDLSVEAGNSQNLEYLEPDEELAKMQAAPFQGVCRIYAPLYRQMTISTYALPEDEQRPFKNIAFRDVLNAFDFYLANYNQGRKIVFLGHSQGSEMLSLVMKERMDQVPELRSQLLLAIIPGFAMHAPIGKTVGGTFTNIPACSIPGEVGCVIAYRSYKEGTVYLGDGGISLLSLEEEICVNPAALDKTDLTLEQRRESRVTLIGSLFPPSSQISNVVRLVASPKPYLFVNGAYSAACASGPDPRNRFLSIAEALPDTDARHKIVLLDSEAISGLTGLHRLDMQFPMAELVNLVRVRSTSN